MRTAWLAAAVLVALHLMPSGASAQTPQAPGISIHEAAMMHLEGARAYARLGQLPQALADYDIVIRAEPDNVAARMERAGLLPDRQRRLAIEDLSVVLRREPANADALQRRADLRLRSGDLNGALADCNSLVADRAIDHVTAYLMRGLILVRLRRPQDAERDFDHVLDRSPLALAYFGRGVARAARGERAAADADFAAARQHDPNVAQAAQSYGLRRRP